MPTALHTGFVRVGTLDELKEKGCIVVRGEQHPIAVFFHDGIVHAVDNRCPHMGFPLSKGSVKDGILTCHWHHARFDLSSGCTFVLFADDVPTAEIEIRDGEVWVAPRTHVADEEHHASRRLIEGMAQNISLVIGKSILSMFDRTEQNGGDATTSLLRDAALFGVRHRDGWASGMTILTAMANLLPHLPTDEKYLALYHGVSRAAGDCAGQVPRRDRYPLEQSDVSLDTLKRWFRDWIRVRHRDGAERTLLTAIQQGASPAQAADILLSAATDRFYADSGHALDFVNKAFELLELIGWQHAPAILPTVVRQLASARGGEELSAWRHPIDLVPLLNGAFEHLPSLLREGKNCPRWTDETSLAEAMLCDTPQPIVEAINVAIRHGARPLQLSKSLCYAAAMRIARFGTANEFGDWITALHSFTYCNALHQCLRRMGDDPAAPHTGALRGVYHGAMSIYLDRFLNVPPAKLPGERDRLDDEPTDAAQLRQKYLDLHNSQQRVTGAARVVARYLSLRHSVDDLIPVLAHGVLREDADFHTFQMLEAAIRQYREWGDSPEGRNILVALARYSSAHSPTQRAELQTAEIALKLHRGKPVYEDD